MTTPSNPESVFIQYDYATSKFTTLPVMLAATQANGDEPIFFKPLQQMGNIPRPDSRHIATVVGNPCMSTAKTTGRRIARAITLKGTPAGSLDMHFIIVLQSDFVNGETMFKLVYAAHYNTAQQGITDDGWGDKTMRRNNAVITVQATLQAHLDSLGKRRAVAAPDPWTPAPPAKKAAPSFGPVFTFGSTPLAPYAPAVASPAAPTPFDHSGLARRPPRTTVGSSAPSPFVSYVGGPGTTPKFAFTTQATGLSAKNFGGGIDTNKKAAVPPPATTAQTSRAAGFGMAAWNVMVWMWGVVQCIYMFVSNIVHAFTEAFNAILVISCFVAVCFFGYFLAVQLWPVAQACAGAIFSAGSFIVSPVWYVVKYCVGGVWSIGACIISPLWSLTARPFVG